MSLSQRLGLPHAGAIVASSNAALALVQLGDEPAAIKEMQKASRRAPGSVDLRAALAGLYWAQVTRFRLPTAADTLNISCLCHALAVCASRISDVGRPGAQHSQAAWHAGKGGCCRDRMEFCLRQDICGLQ